MISRGAATMAAAMTRTEHPITDVADDGGGDL
uniref:Uncharacterized protein n=1 Tax=Arundo donax TaxID=35708 RepID=A0A0A8Y5P8_ARUDO